jgi:hypothetical protein
MPGISARSQHLAALAAVPKYGNALATALKSQLIRRSDVIPTGAVHQIDGFADRRIGERLKCGLHFDVPCRSNLMRGREEFAQMRGTSIGVQPARAPHMRQKRLRIGHFCSENSRNCWMNIDCSGRANHFPPVTQRKEWLDAALAVRQQADGSRGSDRRNASIAQRNRVSGRKKAVVKIGERTACLRQFL